MVIFEDLSKRMQGMVRKYLMSKKAVDKAEAINKKCRDALIKALCENEDRTSQSIIFTEEKMELSINGAPRSDTSWVGAWKEFDALFYPLIENDNALSGEYLRARRTAEINNKKSPYMRWEIRAKDGSNNGT